MAEPDTHTVRSHDSADNFVVRDIQLEDYNKDVHEHKIVATLSIVFERKFVRNCGKVAHIEDVVVDASYRKAGLGRRIVAAAVEAARQAGCYKVILDCAESNAPFYEACGFKRKELQMAQYFV